MRFCRDDVDFVGGGLSAAAESADGLLLEEPFCSTIWRVVDVLVVGCFVEKALTAVIVVNAGTITTTTTTMNAFSKQEAFRIMQRMEKSIVVQSKSVQCWINWINWIQWSHTLNTRCSLALSHIRLGLPVLSIQYGRVDQFA